MKKIIFAIVTVLVFITCKNNPKTTSNSTVQSESETKYPSDVISFMDEWKILLGDGSRSEDLVNYEKKDFFYVENDGKTDWVVYKTPNSGVTSRTSNNTRTELGQKKHWIPETGGKLTGTLKVQRRPRKRTVENLL